MAFGDDRTRHLGQISHLEHPADLAIGSEHGCALFLLTHLIPLLSLNDEADRRVLVPFLCGHLLAKLYWPLLGHIVIGRPKLKNSDSFA